MEEKRKRVEAGVCGNIFLQKVKDKKKKSDNLLCKHLFIYFAIWTNVESERHKINSEDYFLFLHYLDQC